MKKIIISYFLILSILSFSESSEIREIIGTFGNITEEKTVGNSSQDLNYNALENKVEEKNIVNSDSEVTVSRVYEYRPPILAELDRQISIPENRGNLAHLNAQYDRELINYLERIDYNSDTIFFLANQYMMMHNYSKANKIFLMDNRDLKNVFGAATTYRFMGKNQEAVQKYNEAIAIDSSFAENYLGRGLANRNLDNYDSAINDLNRYISMTASEEGYAALGDIYFKLGRRSEAYSIISTGLNRNPGSITLKTLMRNITKNRE
ncbi:MAG: tetratricopeptide repeat protein [Fusobacterium sp.]|nr:tetratricopeptide repeat protein [Fusobacterium sp.]